MASKKDYDELKKIRDENKKYPYLIGFINWSPIAFFVYSFLTIDENKAGFDSLMLSIGAIGTAYSVQQASKNLLEKNKKFTICTWVALGLLLGQIRFYYFNQDSAPLQSALQLIRTLITG